MRPVLSAYRSRVALVASTVALLALSACGSSGGAAAGNGGASATLAPLPTAAAPTGPPIKIGVLADTSSVMTTGAGQGATVAPAWADYVNKDLGGINGHPVQVVVENTKGDPAEAQAAAQKLIDDHVVALVASDDNTFPAWGSKFVAAGIPVLPLGGGFTDFYTNVGYFPLTPDPASVYRNVVNVAVRYGAKHFAVLYCSEVPQCATLNQIMKPVADSAGIGYTSLAVSGSATSYTAQCLALKQAGVDFVALAVTPATVPRVVSDCEVQGFNPTWGEDSQSEGKDMASVKGATFIGVGRVFPTGADSPLVKTFTSVMQHFAADGNWFGGASNFTWTNLIALQKALSHVSRTAVPTANDVTNGLNSFKNETLGGLLPNPVTFTAGKPVGLGKMPCIFVVGMKDGKPTAPQGMTPFCPSR